MAEEQEVADIPLVEEHLEFTGRQAAPSVARGAGPFGPPA